MADDPKKEGSPSDEKKEAAATDGTTKVATPQRGWKFYGWWCAAALLLILVLLFLYPESEPKTTALVSLIPATNLQPVEIEARLDRNVLNRGSESANLVVTVTNRGDMPLHSLQLHLIAPGFVVDSAPFTATPTLECNETKGTTAPLCTLGARGAAQFQVPLRPAARSGTYGITASVDWWRTAHETRSATVGPVTIDSPFGATHWARLGGRVAQLLRDLTLPLLLYWLGTRFTKEQTQQEEQNRDAAEARATRRHEDEKKLEHSRQDAQKKREEDQQVKQLLLSEVLGLAQKYYMPIITNASLALNEEKKIDEHQASASVEKTLYALLKLLKHFDAFRQEKGGMFLQSMPAEYLVSHAWELLKEMLHDVFTEELVYDAIGRQNLLDTFVQFKGQTAEFSRTLNQLKQWITSGEPGTTTGRGKMGDFSGVLDVIQAVLRYEINRPLWEHWYAEEKTGKIQKLEWEFKRGDVTKLPAEDYLSSRQKEHRTYLLNHLADYCGRPAV